MKKCRSDGTEPNTEHGKAKDHHGEHWEHRGDSIFHPGAPAAVLVVMEQWKSPRAGIGWIGYWGFPTAPSRPAPSAKRWPPGETRRFTAVSGSSPLCSPCALW